MPARHENDGATWFLRCAQCHTLYDPAQVLVFDQQENTARMDVVWRPPQRRRKPAVPCTHQSAVERWDGTAWVPVEARAKEQRMAADGPQWKCPQCNYLNEGSGQHCGACGYAGGEG